VLRQIQTNHANLRHGRLPRSWSLTTTFWHFDAVVGPSTPSELEAKIAPQGVIIGREPQPLMGQRRSSIPHAG
jgi:hypothetical protein